MSFLLLLLLTFLLLFTSNSVTTYYVNEESLTIPETGSLSNPFTSIAQAYSSLGATTCDLILLGSSASISTTIVFASGSNYTIRSETSSSMAYFPIYLKSGAVIQMASANLTLQKLQFIELNPSRGTNSPLFAPSASSVLTFQTVLMRDARSTATSYLFCKASSAFVNILDSEFRNLTDFEIALLKSPIVVHGSAFTDLTNIKAPLIILTGYTGPNDGFNFKNNSFELTCPDFQAYILNRNITIGMTITSSGFICTLTCHTNLTFEDFYINNVTLNTEAPFLLLTAGTIANYDTQDHQTSLMIRNVVIQNMFEKPKTTLLNPASSLQGLFLNSNGPTILKVQNLSVTNSIFTNITFMTLIPLTNQFLNTWKVLPTVELKDITMKYTKNANFLIGQADTISISNVYLEDLSIKDVPVTSPLFTSSSGHIMSVYNVTATNVTGPLFQTENMLAHNFSTLSFNNMYTSQELDPSLQNVIFINKIRDPFAEGLDLSRPQDSFFDNINLQGYSYIEEINYSTEDSFFMEISTIFGTVSLTNCVWYNNQLGGFYSDSLVYFEVNNLTVDNDQEIPREQIPPHQGFYFNNAKEIVFRNSIFQNNQNSVILHSHNVAIINSDDEITETFLTLQNVTVRNNSAVYDGTHSSLFIIYSPLKPITVFFSSSYFGNNKILNGLVNSLENYQANMVFANNTFENNYATQSGAILSSSNMRQRASDLNLTNNTFTSNRCDQNGGLFSFILTDYNMHPVNNTYRNNTAGLAGGVGYAFRASFVFLEEQGVYLNNSAGSFGGDWYISLNTYQANLQSLKFFQTSFANSLAKQQGGSIYLENSGITVKNCVFHASRALLAGGNFYVSNGKSINIINTIFSSSSAPEGSFLFSEEIDGTLAIINVQMRDILSDRGKSLLTASSGSLQIKNSVFENIKSSLFLLSKVTASISNTTWNKISCPKSSNSFCLFQVTSSNSIEITDSSLTNIYSDVDIISLSVSNQASFSNFTAQNILKITQESFNQIFVLNGINIPNLNINQSSFFKIGFSSIKVKNTNMKAQDSSFSNRLTIDHRFLAQSISMKNAKLNQLIQFIVLDSSNSTLNNISFIENSLNTLVNGGAVQMLGSNGVHILKNCIFEDNQALNGGALFVGDQANTISILNSQFSHNQAIKNGGALTFSDHSVQNILLIGQTTFYQNIATLGGAIYLGTQALIIDSSSFIQNNAERGGAIATMSSGNDTLVDLRQSSFVSNNASEGAALIALKELNFACSTSSFKENTAEYGGDVASVPTSLRLRIYSFESYFLFIENITAQDLLSNPKTVLVYDSSITSRSESIAFVSGSQPNLLFEIAILDAFGQKMGQTNNAQGKFKIANSSSSSSLVGILGTTAFTYIDSIAQIFNAFSVKGPFGTSLTLSIEGTYDSQASNSLQSLPPLEFAITLEKCSVGQTYEKSSAICSTCSPNTFSIADPFTAQTCQKCIQNAICPGGPFMYPAHGYWRIDASSENFVKCPQTDSCLGGSKDAGRKISLTGFCGEGYEGTACSSCAPGYAKFGSSRSCLNCQESKLYYVMFSCYFLIQATVLIFSVNVNLKNSFKERSIIQSTLIKIVIDFVQILTIISELNFNFPSVIDTLYDAITKILPTNIDALSVDCFIALKKGKNKYIFFDKVLVILSEPFAYMILALITWTIVYRIRKISVFKNPDFKFRMYLTTIVIAYMLQPGIIKIILELFNCKNYGSQEDPKYYLASDVDMECWKHEHLVWALSIAIPTLIIGLILPLGILGFWTREKGAQRSKKVYAFIFKPYQDNALFWEIAILLRKVLLILISVFITSQYLQAYLGFALLGLYYCFLYKISPYKKPQLNSAESTSLASSAFILYSGLYFIRAKEMTTVSYILFACDIFSGTIFVAFIIYVFFKKNAVTIQKRITMLGSKISANLRINILSHNQKQTPELSPVSLSLQSHDPNDSPTSTERFLSTEKFKSIERFISTEGGAGGLMSAERFLSVDRPFSPLIKLHHQSDEEISVARRKSSDTELRAFSPSGAGLSIFGFQQRELNIPVNFQEIELAIEDPNSQQFEEISGNEIKNSPRISPMANLTKLSKQQ